MKHKKAHKYSASPESAFRVHLPPVRMAVTKEATNGGEGGGRREAFDTLPVGLETRPASTQVSMETPPKTKISFHM